MTTTTDDFEEIDLDGDVIRLDDVEETDAADEPLTCCQPWPPTE